MNPQLARTLAAVTVAALLAGCATSPGPQQPPGAHDGWHAVALPGKEHTRYARGTKEGRAATSAVSERSASLWRRHVHPPAQAVGGVSFSWWVYDLVENGNVAVAALEDSPARVIFAFQGDTATLSARTRALFDLAEALTGERPPFATLMYVWDASAPTGTVIINPRSDRIRKIVVDSGPGHLRTWRDHRRDLAADYRRAFGEEPGALLSVAFMTDSDNTRSRAASWYGPVTLH